jgi:large subunit ribosomal protein L27
MAHHKAGGSKASQHISPAGKSLGTKISDGQGITPGMILVRQRGTLYKAGKGVGIGRDHTLFALLSGKAKFSSKLGRKVVSIV